MAEVYDAVVIGGGVVGTSTAYHLARLGAGRVLLLERGQLCAGGTAKSCAIVRTHYSIPTNTELAVKSLAIFRDFAAYLGEAEAESGFVPARYLILAGEGETAETLRHNLRMQAKHGAETMEISREEARELHPRLNLDDIAVVGYEPQSGYADPYLTTMGFAKAARRLGVQLRTRCPVTGLVERAGRIAGAVTAEGEIATGAVIAAIGPWTAPVARWAGVELPLAISRHIVLTFRSGEPYARDLPIVKDMTTGNKMYFRPATGGVVLVGTGDHGDPLEDPDAIDENVDDDFILLQGRQIAHRMPDFETAELVDSWVGPYDIPPDWNPVLDEVREGLFVAYGFSGHGFKLAPMVGKCMAQRVLGATPEVDLRPYRLTRFVEGDLLTGRYGIGSIS